MEQIKKQCIGIDVAKDDFMVTFSVLDVQEDIKHLSSRSFSNNENGFKTFNKWLGKLYTRSVKLQIVLEATGIYHEKLTYFLDTLGYNVAVVLPKRAKDFSKTLKVKAVTDKVSSQYLSIMGIEKKLDAWVKPEKVYVNLKHLTRERDRIQHQITQIKNQIHAEESGVISSVNTQKRLRDILKLLVKQKSLVIREIGEIIASDGNLREKVKQITTIPGVGLCTAATVIGETHGFSQIKNKRQLVSYAGYDILTHQSGISVNSKSRISKKGNKNIRKAMHMPALTAIRKNGSSKETFIRVVERTSIKMKGVVAVQRKLLVLMYTLWKNNSEFDHGYESKKRGSNELPHELDLVRSLG